MIKFGGCLQLFAVDRLLGLRLRIPPGALMSVLCVVSEDKGTTRTIKRKKQVRKKEQRENMRRNLENKTKISSRGKKEARTITTKGPRSESK